MLTQTCRDVFFSHFIRDFRLQYSSKPLSVKKFRIWITFGLRMASVLIWCCLTCLVILAMLAPHSLSKRCTPGLLNLLDAPYCPVKDFWRVSSVDPCEILIFSAVYFHCLNKINSQDASGIFKVQPQKSPLTCLRPFVFHQSLSVLVAITQLMSSSKEAS